MDAVLQDRLGSVHARIAVCADCRHQSAADAHRPFPACARGGEFADEKMSVALVVLP